MTLRYIHSTLAVAVLMYGVMVGLAHAQQRDGGLLPPDQSGRLTVTGCLMRGDQIRDGDSDKFVLANPTATPVESSPEGTCTAESGANAIQLDNPRKGNIDESMLGRLVQISGRLEKETSHDNILREFDVESARLVPMAQRTAAAPAPEPKPAAAEPSPAPAPAEAPVATSGQSPALPKTAGNEPAIALLGLFALAAGMTLKAMPARLRG